jgi:hypothetical protein
VHFATVRSYLKSVHPAPSIAKIYDIVDALYQDPVNSYVPWANICSLARSKLMGDDIEKNLQTLRKNVIAVDDKLKNERTKE